MCIRDRFYNFIKEFNATATLLETPAGSASAIKMFKSVFSKGFPQLLLECLIPAAEYGVMDIVFDSFKHTFDNRTIEAVSYTHLDVYKRQIWSRT